MQLINLFGKERIYGVHYFGMSQGHFDTELNTTFQQVQKNEPCESRISNWRLLDISQMWHVPINYFFDDMSQDPINGYPLSVSRSGEIHCNHAVGRIT